MANLNHLLQGDYEATPGQKQKKDRRCVRCNGTNNKREALATGKQAISEGWSHVQVRENKYSGYSEAVLLDHGNGNFVTVH